MERRQMVELLLAIQTVTNVVKMYMEPYLKKRAELDAVRNDKVNNLDIEGERRMTSMGGSNMKKLYKVINKTMTVNVIGMLLLFIFLSYRGHVAKTNGLATNSNTESTFVSEDEDKEGTKVDTPLLDNLTKEEYQEVTGHFEEAGITKAAQREAEEMKKELESLYSKEIKEQAVELFLGE